MNETNDLRDRTAPGEIEAQANELVHENVKAIAGLEAAQRQMRTRTDRIVDAISTFCGSLSFVHLHTAWFALWIGLNLSPVRRWHFDPFPFGLLTLVVSLESIYLSTFILISQNRQSQTADRRNHLDLQINMLAEQENTKMLAMLERIEKRLGINEEDPAVAALEAATEPQKLIDEIKNYVEETGTE
jgi:uncharacterized membrane protein